MILTTYTKRDFDRFYGEGFWQNETFAQALSEAAARTPAKIAVSDPSSKLTYAELQREVARIAAALEARGVRSEDVVSVQLPNRVELAVTILALAQIGAVYNPLNPGYRRTEIENIVRLVKPKAIVCAAEFKGFRAPDVFDDVLDRETTQVTIAVGNVPPQTGWEPWHALSANGHGHRTNGASASSFRNLADPDAPFLLGATSGTTAAPKVYIHTANTQLQEARRINQLLGISASDVLLAMAPMTHRGALLFGLFTAIAAGATLTVLPAFSAEEALSVIEREKVTAFMAIPTQVVDMLALCASCPRETTSLRRVLLSGAPVLPSLVTELGNRWSNCIPITGYGLSETGYTTLTLPNDPKEKLVTSGRPTPGMEIRIVGESGVVATGSVGEIQIRGPQVCAGYFDNQTATAAALTHDGWFRTGDLGSVDEDGYLKPVGRLKHVIIRGGLKIHAEEVEFLLSQHPAVLGAVVLPIPDARLGERACACVILRDGKRLELGDVISFFEERKVAKYMTPERVVVLSEFPQNAVGKIDRRTLQEQLSAERF